MVYHRTEMAQKMEGVSPVGTMERERENGHMNMSEDRMNTRF
jgi:hypothetical protein